MGVQQYDEIGEAFEGFKSLPLAHYAEVPGFLAMVGDVRGKSVLDLASGTGFYSREFKRRGATEVLGIDISGEMVSVARELEERDGPRASPERRPGRSRAWAESSGIPRLSAPRRTSRRRSAPGPAPPLASKVQSADSVMTGEG
nr:methyltransferase domain-containing protein [Streptomyces yunnanensis]